MAESGIERGAVADGAEADTAAADAALAALAVNDSNTSNSSNSSNSSNAPLAAPTAPDPNASLVAVSDSGGFLGAFLSVPEANTKVIERYPLVPFLVQRFPLAAGEPLSHVWAVPYRDTTALAVVTNSREEAERVRRALALVGLAYEDSVDYWKLPLGAVVESGAERLESQRRAHLMYADSAVDAELLRQAAAGEKAYRDLSRAQEESAAQLAADGPIAQLIRENARIGFLDCVVDFGFEDDVEGALGAADTEGALGATEADTEGAAEADTAGAEGATNIDTEGAAEAVAEVKPVKL
ncbi:MAG: hypothetical protein EBS05_27265 [Proteobacteria bacterium]|nr:hypothetical protein [Pseudomonadota bacterium]